MRNVRKGVGLRAALGERCGPAAAQRPAAIASGGTGDSVVIACRMAANG
jgi:hypothetical protein